MSVSSAPSIQGHTLKVGSDPPILTTLPISELLGPSSPFYLPPSEPRVIISPQEFTNSPEPRSRHTRPQPSSRTSFPQIIPPENSKRSRTLVLCFDGTGDQYDQDNSNIVQFIHLLNKDNPNNQMVYYQAGIGTTSKGFITPIGVAISKAVDMAVAHGLQDHVTDGYEFLMQNYSDGDKICLFGFSRGAYTARALAGMLHKVGLLPRANYQQVPFAYHMYQRDDEEGWEMSKGFKQAFSIDVEIHFMGLFDTVNSVGLIPCELPFAKSNYVVRYFRHAIALDERRSKFKDNLWGRTSDQDAALAAPPRGGYVSKRRRERLRKMSLEVRESDLVDYGTAVVGTVGGAVGSVSGTVEGVGRVVKAVKRFTTNLFNTIKGDPIFPTDRMNSRKNRTAKGSGIYLPSQDAPLPTEPVEKGGRLGGDRPVIIKEPGEIVAHAIGGKRVRRAETDVEEVWFAGAHTDVGGGSVKNGERYSLARISLRWMIRQCFKCDTGIMFHSNLFEDVGLSPETLWPEVLARPPPITSINRIPKSSIKSSSESYRPRCSRCPTRSDTGLSSGPYQLRGATLPGRRVRQYTQISGKVDPYEPYIPIHWRMGHELRDFGPHTWEPREPFINEEIEDFKDALSPIYDQLSMNWWWWILEFIPIKQVLRKKEKGWRRVFGINLGGPRVIPHQKRRGVNVHRTVKTRIEARADLDGNPFSYTPRAVLKKPWIQWLDGSERDVL
ncbi:unnamed protein product [Rhizoctonia solani]|uniref:T6SS Phospholipase effector Tle1-like catalytic domain-containing protein n=1 Tax=Rhizoctonia solani TaxID=456999 RepID=A0A8H3CE82_9AGAM|nr:unnamed protein product [Rhizoctonia solani]